MKSVDSDSGLSNLFENSGWTYSNKKKPLSQENNYTEIDFVAKGIIEGAISRYGREGTALPTIRLAKSGKPEAINNIIGDAARLLSALEHIQKMQLPVQPKKKSDADFQTGKMAQLSSEVASTPLSSEIEALLTQTGAEASQLDNDDKKNTKGKQIVNEFERLMKQVIDAK